VRFLANRISVHAENTKARMGWDIALAWHVQVPGFNSQHHKKTKIQKQNKTKIHKSQESLLNSVNENEQRKKPKRKIIWILLSVKLFYPRQHTL
jgi:hypothetical protein